MSLKIRIFHGAFCLGLAVLVTLAGSGPAYGRRARKSSTQLFSVPKFQKLSRTLQRKYIKRIQRAATRFQKSLEPHRTSAGNISILFDVAHARYTSGTPSLTCITGGVARPRATDKSCNSEGRNCDGPGTYRCGVVYNSVCVKADGHNAINSACSSAPNNTPSPAYYQRFEADINNINRKVCGIEPIPRDHCADFNQQLDKINTDTTVAAIAQTAVSATQAQSLPAPAPAPAQSSKPNAPAAAPVTIAPRVAPAHVVVASDGSSSIFDSSQCLVSPGCAILNPPVVQTGSATFSDDLTISAPLCSGPNSPSKVVLTDKNGNLREFYKNEQGEVCQKLTSQKPNSKSLGPQIAIATGSTGDLCKTPSGCSQKIGGLIEKRLKTLQKSDAVKNSGFCGGVFSGDRKACPPKSVRKKCAKALKKWNSKSCPGGENAKIRSQRLTAAVADGQKKKREGSFNASARLGKSDRRRCERIFKGFEDLEANCGSTVTQEQYLSRVSALRSDFQTFGGGESSNSLQGLLKKMATYGGNSDASCSQALRDCAGALDNLSNLTTADSYSKDFCGDDLDTPKSIGVGDSERKIADKVGVGKNTQHTDRIVGLDGKNKAKISIKKDVITIESTDRNKPALKIRIGENGNDLKLYQGSKRATEPLLGSFQTSDANCPDTAACSGTAKAAELDLSAGSFEVQKGTQCLLEAGATATGSRRESEAVR